MKEQFVRIFQQTANMNENSLIKVTYYIQNFKNHVFNLYVLRFVKSLPANAFGNPRVSL